MPESAIRSSRTAPGAISSGACSGRSTAIGWGSKVIATAGSPSR